MTQYLNELEIRINNTTDKEEIKRIVKEMFEDVTIEDVDFTDMIYDVVYPRLKDLGIDFDNGYLLYEKILKEEY